VIRQLVAIGAVQRGEGERAGLALVPDRARPILRGETTVMLREETPDPIAGRTRSRSRVAPQADSGTPAGPFEALRSWRAQEAKTQAVPAYVIFQDTVLREIAAVQPRSLDELALVKGVGASKLERYGAAILRVLEGADA
jgi:ATP-dependent DNA helicase RecQ